MLNYKLFEGKISAALLDLTELQNISITTTKVEPYFTKK